MKVLRTIRRQFNNMDRECFTILYKSFVRQHMEFAIQVWSPYLNRHQMSSYQIGQGILEVSYEDRLRKLKLTSLVTSPRSQSLSV